MNKNTLGVLLIGLFIGFGLGVTFTKSSSPASPTPPAESTVPTSKSAPPLSPTAGQQLPANHPAVEGEIAPPKPAGAAPAANQELETATIEANTNLGDYILQMKAAAVCYQANQFDQALVFLTRAQVLRPDSVDVLLGLGTTNAALEKYDEAEKYLTKALKVTPNDPEANAELAVTYNKQKKYDVAIAAANRSLKTAPGQERALEALVEAYLEKKNTREASTALAKLSGLNPSNPSLAVFRQQLEKLQGQGPLPSH